MRLSVAIAVACISMVGLSAAGEASASVRRHTAISTQGLGPALQQLARDRDVQFVYRSEVVGDRQTSGASGYLTFEESLTKLLEGTGLTYQFLGERAITIIPLVGSTSLLKEAESPNATRNYLAMSGAEGPGGSGTASSTGAVAPMDLWPRFRLAQVDQERAANEGQSGTPDVIAEARPAARLEEIIVTAQKREERIIDVPVSIAVISNQEIERRGLIGMEDYLRSIPGVNLIDNGPINNAIIIRGITTSPTFENFFSGTTTATYFDETAITAAGGMGAGGIDVRPVDFERIEVLRGPQGTTLGSASIGGALRLIPAKPKLDGISARVTANYSNTSGTGSDNSMIQAVVNIPVVADKFAVRAVGYRYDESGFYRNIAGIDPTTIASAESFGLGDFVRGYVQDDVGRLLSTGGRLAALWQATDRLSLSMNFLTQTLEQDGSPLTTVGKFEQTKIPLAPQSRERGEAGEVFDTEMDLANLVLNYDLKWAALTSVVSWIDSGSVWAFAGDLPFGSQNGTSDFNSFTAEIRLASQLPGRLQFLTGLFYEDIDDHFVELDYWPGPPETNVWETDPAFQADPLFLYDSTRLIEQRALFGEVSYGLTDKLTATLGGRYFEYEKTESLLQEGIPYTGVPLGAGVTETLRSSDSDSIYKANFSYKPTKDAMLYASWTEGFRLGRPAPGLPAAVCDLDGDGVIDGTSVPIESTRNISSDFLTNYEIGAKFTLFDQRMTIDTSVYHIDWNDMPILVTLPPGSCGRDGAAYTGNAGAATSEGMEFQASLFVLEGLRLDFGGGYTKAELAKDAPNIGGQAGDRLPGSPEVSANLAVQYDFDLADYSAFIRADSLYVAEFYAGVGETGTAVGDYIKIDARAGMAIKNLSVELFVRNVTDEDAFTWPASVGGYRLRPRTIGIQLGYSFD